MKNVAYAVPSWRWWHRRRGVASLLADTYARNDGTARLQPARVAPWAMTYAKRNFECPLAFHLTTSQERDSILIDGNTATGARVPLRRAPSAGADTRFTPATARHGQLHAALREVSTP